jgi:hypothetical protein
MAGGAAVGMMSQQRTPDRRARASRDWFYLVRSKCCNSKFREWLAALPCGCAVTIGSARRGCTTGPAGASVTGGSDFGQALFSSCTPR